MGEAGAVRLAGYAAVFDVPDRGRDVVRRGAFGGVQDAVRAEAGVPLLWQHGAERPVGRIVSAREDRKGLRIVADLAAGSRGGREAAALVKAGALSGLSFGYRTKRARRDRVRGLRELLSVELVEVSLVTFPMQPLARVVGVFGGAGGGDAGLPSL
jgi:HK97 family phage prohead protease